MKTRKRENVQRWWLTTWRLCSTQDWGSCKQCESVGGRYLAPTRRMDHFCLEKGTLRHSTARKKNSQSAKWRCRVVLITGDICSHEAFCSQHLHLNNAHILQGGEGLQQSLRRPDSHEHKEPGINELGKFIVRTYRFSISLRSWGSSSGVTDRSAMDTWAEAVSVTSSTTKPRASSSGSSRWWVCSFARVERSSWQLWRHRPSHVTTERSCSALRLSFDTPFQYFRRSKPAGVLPKKIMWLTVRWSHPSSPCLCPTRWSPTRRRSPRTGAGQTAPSTADSGSLEQSVQTHPYGGTVLFKNWE